MKVCKIGEVTENDKADAYEGYACVTGRGVTITKVFVADTPEAAAEIACEANGGLYDPSRCMRVWICRPESVVRKTKPIENGRTG